MSDDPGSGGALDESPEGGEGEVSGIPAEDPEIVLRRIEKMLLGWAVVGAVGWLAAASAGGLPFLTVGALAGIVLFRGLQRATRRWSSSHDQENDSISVAPIVLRFAILALLPLSTLWLDNRQALALMVGFSALPLALTTEALRSLLTAPRSRSSSDS